MASLRTPLTNCLGDGEGGVGPVPRRHFVIASGFAYVLVLSAVEPAFFRCAEPAKTLKG